MECYVLVLVYGGILESVTTYPYNPQGLNTAKKDARDFAIDTMRCDDGDAIHLYDCPGGTGSDILGMEEIMGWRKEAGLSVWD
jgi:hypothetical protein